MKYEKYKQFKTVGEWWEKAGRGKFPIQVPAAISNIESHGIRMVLVTGDLVGTALSVAKDLHWQVREDEVLSGADIRNLSKKVRRRS